MTEFIEKLVADLSVIASKLETTLHMKTYELIIYRKALDMVKDLVELDKTNSKSMIIPNQKYINLDNEFDNYLFDFICDMSFDLRQYMDLKEIYFGDLLTIINENMEILINEFSQEEVFFNELKTKLDLPDNELRWEVMFLYQEYIHTFGDDAGLK
jgi:hypothetical protein